MPQMREVKEGDIIEAFEKHFDGVIVTDHWVPAIVTEVRAIAFDAVPVRGTFAHGALSRWFAFEHCGQTWR